jgi:hypothetical protein
LTTVRAGLAAICISSPVFGLRPMRAACGGFLWRLTFNRPGRTKRPGPFLPIWALMKSDSASITWPICFLVRPVVPASDAYTSVFVGAFGLSLMDAPCKTVDVIFPLKNGGLWKKF